jgi:endogenous inhibitor of DNA gyrase (YacG/DUF329 family)
MPELKCPACGHRGEIRGTEEFFEHRGKHPLSRMPVAKCRGCGSGLEFRLRGFFFPFLGFRVRQIPDDFWSHMEAIWERELGSSAGPTEQRSSSRWR